MLSQERHLPGANDSSRKPVRFRLRIPMVSARCIGGVTFLGAGYEATRLCGRVPMSIKIGL